MSRNKWEHFRNTLAVDITTPNTGWADLLLDWHRVLPEGRVTINGVDLSKIASIYNNFKEEGDLSNFFSQIILKDMTTFNEIEKGQIIGYMKQIFHQGGFLNPVSTPIALSMHQKMKIMTWENGKKVEVERVMPVLTAAPETTLHIITTPTGFKVQEIATAKKVLVISDEYREQHKIDPLDPYIKPDAGYDYVYKAQGTLELNFKNCKEINQPIVTVESSSINYGSATVKKLLDKRSIGEMIVDFFKHILKLNKVEIFTPVKLGVSGELDVKNNSSDNETAQKAP